MAAFANANTKRYSWWWDSHISPKNSKWLQENLTDMDSKVKQMIKVIEEDADSFARRAEMYYKKRPELMKLVEEFYRAYRALAERYDHATGVIRHAQQTMAEAFPNQDPMMFGEESLVGPSTEEFDPQTPESYPPIRAPVYPSDLKKAFMEDPQGLKIGKARRGLNFNDADGNGRNAKVLSESERASKAEAEIVALKDALAKANERASQAEGEIIALKESLVGSETEKEAALVQYQQCLETISNLEERLRKAEEDARLINQRAENADEEKCVVLERSNQNLHSELDGLLEKLENQSHELTEKQKEMGKLWTTVQEEHLRFVEAETAFQTLQQLHSQSQEELNTLALELQNRSEILKDMEARNSGLLEEVQEAKEESKSLNELNLASAASIISLQEEVSRLLDQRNALQQEIYCLKEELSQMGKKHQSMVEGFGSSIKELQVENSKLKETKEREGIEKTALLEKLELMKELVEKNLLLEKSISDLNSELETIRGKLKTLEEAFAEEKSGLHSEKNMLVSRLQIATEDSKKLSEENRLLENSLFDANAELEELKSKLKSLEDSCHLLNDDKSSLVNERESLLSRMDVMRKSIEDLEKEQAELNVKVLELATERESCLQKIGELGVSLDTKDRDYASFVQLSESQMNGMKSKIQRQGREYQEELDRAHDAHVEIIVLQNCLQDWLEKSSSLVAENQNLKQASHLLEKLVSELEQENIGKQVQIDSSFIRQLKSEAVGLATGKNILEKENESQRSQLLLLQDEIQKLICMNGELNTKVNQGVDREEVLKVEVEDVHRQSAIENLVLVEFLKQLKSEASGITTEKKALEEELESKRSQLLLSLDEAQELGYMIKELTRKVNQGVSREEVLKVEVDDLHKQSAIENLVLVEFLQQLRSEATGIATEKSVLEEKLESHRDQLSFSRNETKNLSHMNGELTTKVNQGINREEVLKVEIEDLHRQSAIEKLVHVEFLHQLKSEAVSIATEKKNREEELESKSSQLSLLRDEAKNLSHMIEELTTKVNQGVYREEVLKVENEGLQMLSAIENLQELQSQLYLLSFSQDETKKLSHMIEELTTKVNQGVNREQVLKVEVDDMHMQSVIDNLVLVESLKQLKSEAVGVATKKKTIEEELESQRSKLSFSQEETKNLLYMIGELTTKVDQGVGREKVLKVEVDHLHMQSTIENLVLVEFLQQLKSEAVEVLKVENEDLHMHQVLQLRNDYATLQGENHKTLDEKTYLTKSTLRLEEEKRKLEEDISFLLSETIYQSNLIILLEGVVLEKLSEAVKLNEDLDRLEEEVREVGDKLTSRETENLQLGSLLEKTDAELLSARSANDQLEHEIADVKDELVQKEKELLEAMLMISIVQSEKSELSKAVEDLECRYKETKAIEEDKDKQVLKLQGDYEEQVKKTGHANEANMKLEADLLNLLMELEGIKAEKAKLNRELSKEKSEEVELWESQASTLFGDLQISVVQYTLLEGLIHELAEAYNSLENRCTLKDVEIDQLRGRVNNLEDANKGQEDLMSKYFQAIILLKETIESLEKHIDMPHELEDEPAKDTASMVDNKEGFLELEEMCLRIKAIEEALTKKLAVEELKTSARRSRRRSGSLWKQNHESEMITKDIVLDQVSDCSSYGISKRDILKIEDDHSFEVQTGKFLSEESLVVDKLEISDRFTDPNKEVNKRKVLERLHSDLQKLSNLHIAVEDLKSKVEREETSEKGKEDEYETVKGQIHEAEEALEKLLSVNRKLVTKVISGFEISDGSKSSVDLDEDERSRRRRISEQARRGSEKIGRLQFEIQRLQFLLLKLEGEREDRAKAKTSDSKTRTLLKDYIYGGVRGERRKRIKKRFAFCGCVQQPPPSP
uniref:NAB domain-containing protein n=1 Tax=Brassica campestris TaxID=3711 RepID=A0A3P6CVS7_BRACM|nr:unnamed protein product [Brassica rapa]